MKITLVQTDIIWEDKLKNLENLEKIISKIPEGTDIVVLPEMFNTGFSMNPERLGEPAGSVTTEWLSAIAENKNIGIGGSIIIREDGRYFNRWIFISPEKETWYYNKRHLFSPGNEDESFTHGTQRVVFNFRGLRICPNICYDLRFPVWTRCMNDYDLIINSANWPEKRRDVWLTLLKARAIENQCYVAGVNRIGIDGMGIKYCGDSAIFNPYGEMISSGPNNKEVLVSGDISITGLAEFRQKFPVMNDADDFIIKI
jgi:predicted amidohydrolase